LSKSNKGDGHTVSETKQLPEAKFTSLSDNMLGEKPALSPPALHGSMMKYDAELKAGNTESAEQDERAQWHNSI